MIPPEANAALVCAMEDVLEVYHRPFDPKRPAVCLDETSKQLVSETRSPVPAAPGRPGRVDDEYERRGTANVFLVTEPLIGQRWATVTDRRTAVDVARLVKDLVDVRYRAAEKVVLVLDDLNTHHGASLYEAFPPAEARRRLEELEIPHTPRHGSWLNVAEIELSLLARQCLDRRIARREEWAREVGAWQRRRDREHGTVDGQFSTHDARVKLKRLYPSAQLG